jgi:putative peptidoglycan lipid II flippase
MINENNKAVKTVSLIILFTAFSKVLGLVRDIFMAYFYGGGEAFAAFAAASRIPRDFFDIFLGAAILGVFIPVYNSFDSNEEKNRDEFANIFLNFVILATGLLAFFGSVFSEQIINIMVPGFTPAMTRLASVLLRILFPMIVFTGAVFTLTGILQSKGEFLAPALVSAVSNLGIIIYFLFFNERLGDNGIYGLGWAYLTAWAIQLLTLAVPLIRKKYKYKFIINLKNQAFIKSIKMSLPIMAGSWIVPFGMLTGIRFLSMSDKPDFYVSSFNYSMTVFLLVTGILTYGICNYIFPKLAQNASNDAEFAKIVKNGLSASLFIIAPVACIAYVLRGEAIAVLFMRGEFTADLAASTADMFAMLALSMIMFSTIEILNRVFYSKNLVKFPMMASLSGIAVNFILCMVFMSVLNLPPVYITLAVLICQSVAAGVLIFALGIKIKEIFDKKFMANIAKIVLSSGILLIIIKILYCIIENNAFYSGFLNNILVAAAILITGVCVYIGANLIFRTNETKMFVKNMKKQR